MQGEIFLIVLELFDLKKYVGDRLILELPRLTVYTGDKSGIVGHTGGSRHGAAGRRDRVGGRVRAAHVPGFVFASVFSGTTRPRGSPTVSAG